jgi:hypothetical protein
MHSGPDFLFRRLLAVGAVSFFCGFAVPARAQDSTATARDSTVAIDTAGSVTVNNATDTLTQVASAASAGTLDSSTQSGETWYTNRKDSVDINPLVVQPLRSAADSDVWVLRKKDDFWYVPVGPGKPKDPPKMKEPWRPGPLVIFAIWTLIGGALVAALVVIIQSGSGESWFKRNRRLKKLVVEQDDPELHHPTDPTQALKEAIDREDYTSAVRFLFLITLASMSERKLILSAREKTNRIYLRELQGSPLYADFARLVRHYDYTFYGGFPPDPTSFREIREQYEQYQNRLSSL